MKKIFLFFILISTTITIFSQVLFTYGPNTVTKDEFLRAYNKNKTTVIDKQSALREYLDLYIKFKLKVKAAQDMRLDTLSSLANDLKNFRSQIEEGYLTDNKTLEKLIQQAFTRSQEDLHLQHLFVAVNASNNNDQKIIRDIQQQLYKGETFTSIVKDLETKGIQATAADIGYITVLSLPYRYENIAYDLISPGKVSNGFFETGGYHFFKLLDKRKAAGKIKVAQILIAMPEGANTREKNISKKLADSLYNALVNGADFAETAKKFSDDKISYMNGGLLPEFGTGKYDPSFELNVFALQINGDVSKPFLTSFGYHIVKKIESTPVSINITDANTYTIIKQKVQEDERGETAKEDFVLSKLAKTPVKYYTINYNMLDRITDSFIVNPNYKITVGKISKKTVLYSLGNLMVTVQDWLKFVRDYKINHPNITKDEMQARLLLPKQIKIIVTEYYRKRLEQTDPDFRYQMQEFKDGNMLFEVMQKYVWDKAANDTAGLQKFYNQNKNKYTWKESADAILISAANENSARYAMQQITKGISWRQVAEENTTQLQADSGRYELSQLPTKVSANFAAGQILEPLINEVDGTASFVKIIKTYPANQPRNFSDARGLVINDYQTYLEEKWIEQLKKKYPIKVDEKVFGSML